MRGSSTRFHQAVHPSRRDRERPGARLAGAAASRREDATGSGLLRTSGNGQYVAGPTGIGKSWHACALGNLAARAGFTVSYLRAPRLFETLHQSRGDGTHLKALGRLAKVQVLMLDDFLITPLAPPERKDLLEIIEDRYQAAATIIAGQCPVKRWHDAIGDPTLADAICDRLVHNAYKIELKGPTIRPKDAKE